MSLKDMLALVDDKLHDVFAKPAHDPEKARKPLLSAIEKAKSQFENGKTKVPHRQWTVANGVVEYSPHVAGEAVQIGGKTTVYVPSERFVNFLHSFHSAVSAGEFDAELENGGKGDATVKTPRAARKPRDPNAPKPEGREWSPERRAKFAETIAARKAAKGA